MLTEAHYRDDTLSVYLLDSNDYELKKASYKYNLVVVILLRNSLALFFSKMKMLKQQKLLSKTFSMLPTENQIQLSLMLERKLKTKFSLISSKRVKLIVIVASDQNYEF